MLKIICEFTKNEIDVIYLLFNFEQFLEGSKATTPPFPSKSLKQSARETQN